MSDPLDDVLALLAEWRQFGNACANKRDGDQYLTCAGDMEALLPAIKAALENDRRYRWLRDRLDSVDFAYCEPHRTVLAFAWPDNVPLCADLDRNIDAAQEAK